LNEWNCEVEFPKLENPIVSFKSLQEIIEKCYEMEYNLLCKYETNSIAIFPVCQKTFNLMNDFVRTQNTSVINKSNIRKKLMNYLPTDPGLVQFDREVFMDYSSVYY